MSYSLRPHGLQHTRLPCPSPSPGACSNSCPLSQWCHPTILSSVVPFSCLQSFPASVPFLMNQLFRWPKYWSFSFNISPSNEYSGLISFRIDCLDPLAVRGTLKSLLQHHSSKASIFWHLAIFRVQLSHPYMTTGKTIALSIWTLSACSVSAFQYVVWVCYSFSSKEQARFNFMAAVTICSDFGAQENSLSLFLLFPHLFALKWCDQIPWCSISECWVLSQLFHSPLSPPSRGSLLSLRFLP